MKTATVRDLRNSFGRISRWLEAGERVEVTKRGQIFAHITPAAAPKRKRGPKPDILDRLRADFGNLILSDKIFDEVLTEAKASHFERLS